MTGLITDLERKFCALGGDVAVSEGNLIEGYASLFGAEDQGGDVVEPGAYGASLAALASKGGRVKMLWQHDPSEPIGVWDIVREDDRGLYVKGRILTAIRRGQEAAVLVAAGAIDGLSIGYRTKKAQRNGNGQRRLAEIELWEVSLVTFPMLPDARVGGKGDTSEGESLRELAAALRDAGRDLTGI